MLASWARCRGLMGPGALGLSVSVEGCRCILVDEVEDSVVVVVVEFSRVGFGFDDVVVVVV